MSERPTPDNPRPWADLPSVDDPDNIEAAQAALAAELAKLKDIPAEEQAVPDPKKPSTDDDEAELVDDTPEQRSPTDDRQERGETGGAGTIEGRSPEQGSEDPA